MWKWLHWTPTDASNSQSWSTFVHKNEVVYKKDSKTQSKYKNRQTCLQIGGINDTLEENLDHAAQLTTFFGSVQTLDHTSLGNPKEQIEQLSSLAKSLKGPLNVVGFSMGTFLALHLATKVPLENCILQSPFLDAREVSAALYLCPLWVEDFVAGISLVSPTQGLHVKQFQVCIRNQDARVQPIHSEKLVQELRVDRESITVLYHDGGHEFRFHDFFQQGAT